MSTRNYFNEKFIRPKHIQQQFGVSYRTIYNWIAAGVLPEPCRPRPQIIGWFPSDLDDFYKSIRVTRS